MNVGAPSHAPAADGRRAVVTLLAIAVVLGLLAVGCASPRTPTSTLGPVESASIAAPATGAPGAPSSPVTGVLISVAADGLTQVRGFVLRTGDGEELTFRIGTLENGAEFPPGHLAEHLASSVPVRVHFRAEAGDLVVYRLEDASPG